MIIDKELELADGQAITGDALSTNIIDFGVAGYKSHPDQLWLVVQCDTAFDNLTSLDIEVWTDDTTTVTSGVQLLIKNVLLAALTAGAGLWKVKLPVEGMQRYLGINWDVNGTNPTAGAVSAFLTNGIDDTDMQS